VRIAREATTGRRSREAPPRDANLAAVDRDAIDDPRGAGPVTPLRLVVYSDFLCPWCWNAATRLAAVEAQLAGAVELEWRSFLLRPRPQTGRDLERFRDYTRSWLRVAQDEPRAPFRAWQGDAGPPSHSVPAHRVAKAAAALGPAEARRMRDRLFRAYFVESRDISEDATLLALWGEAALPEAAYARREDPELLRSVLADHEEALELGATGVPAARLDGDSTVLMGALPEETYLRWLRRALVARGGPRAGRPLRAE
jgi:predicted DsbA family dithiol-disulfide isomerase